MLSLSVAFHIGSALLLIGLFWRLAVYRRWTSLLRRWADPTTAGIMVAEPLCAIGDFSAALNIPFTGSVAKNATAAKISLAPLFKLHAECGISRIECSGLDNPVVSFVVRRSSATIEEDQRSVERSFSNRLRVSIVVAP